ncbi:hypothetical protein ACFFGH_26300 [Lysobacter korlensis]|uniref:Uncharacterized protein n=1 Tax=Lysobacter korlensis TaxID=553636 RepID=A0ABV6RZP0_9GAMM
MTEPPVYDGPFAGAALVAAVLVTAVLLLRPPRSWDHDQDDERRDSR